MNRSFLILGVMMWCAVLVPAQNSNPPAARTLPARLNPAVPAVELPPPPPLPPGIAAPPKEIAVRPAALPPAVVADLANNILAWDSELKEYTTKPGEMEAHFTFYFTNVSKETVSITSAAATCGCTVPKLPPLPWKNEPGATGEIPVTMNLAGKSGVIMKILTVNSDHGRKLLNVKANITPPQVTPPTAMDRNKNQEMAKADRQAVFKGDCASCHGTPVSNGKVGADLYKSVCGVCHEAEHRATMVTDLHALNHDTNADYWKTWISLGKPGSLMPGFAQSEGGPLTEVQINSIVQYLVTAIPTQAKRTAGLK